jgi:hypothetical protein
MSGHEHGNGAAPGGGNNVGAAADAAAIREQVGRGVAEERTAARARAGEGAKRTRVQSEADRRSRAGTARDLRHNQAGGVRRFMRRHEGRSPFDHFSGVRATSQQREIYSGRPVAPRPPCSSSRPAPNPAPLLSVCNS